MVRKRREGVAEARGALVLVHGFGQNRYAWHLPGRSFVNHLAGVGWDVFNLDLRGHGRSRARGSTPSASLDAYIAEDLPMAVDAACALSGFTRSFVLGHSLGGVVACAAAPAMLPSLAGLVTLAAPWALGRGNRVLLELVRAANRAADWADAHGAAVPMRFVQGLFQRTRALWDHRRVPLPLRAWHPGSFEPALLDEYLARSFDRATLGELAHLATHGVDGAFHSDDGRVDYARAWAQCDVPLLVIAGTRDLLAPVESVRAAYDVSASRDRTLRLLPFGHGDLLLGREAPSTTWRVVDAWLAARVDRCGKFAG